MKPHTNTVLRDLCRWHNHNLCQILSQCLDQATQSRRHNFSAHSLHPIDQSHPPREIHRHHVLRILSRWTTGKRCHPLRDVALNANRSMVQSLATQPNRIRITPLRTLTLSKATADACGNDVPLVESGTSSFNLGTACRFLVDGADTCITGALGANAQIGDIWQEEVHPRPRTVRFMPMPKTAIGQ